MEEFWWISLFRWSSFWSRKSPWIVGERRGRVEETPATDATREQWRDEKKVKPNFVVRNFAFFCCSREKGSSGLWMNCAIEIDCAMRRILEQSLKLWNPRNSELNNFPFCVCVSEMESSTPASSSADDSNAQDPLALPSANESIGLYSNSDGRNQNGLCGSESLNIDKENGLDPVYPNDPSMKREEHPLNHEQRLQYDANHQMSSNYANNDQQKINHMNMQQNLHEPHKTFSHSIENLSKTTEKCAPNDIKMWVAFELFFRCRAST